MYITKIDGNYNYKNKPYFSAKIPKKELIQELKKIAVSESPNNYVRKIRKRR